MDPGRDGIRSGDKRMCHNWKVMVLVILNKLTWSHPRNIHLKACKLFDQGKKRILTRETFCRLRDINFLSWLHY